MTGTDVATLADGNTVIRGTHGPKGNETPSHSRLSGIERVVFYAGAIGLGLGHSLSAQLVLLVYQLYRLAVDPSARATRATRSTIALLALGAWMMASGVSAVSRFDAWGGTVGMALSVWVTLEAVNRVMADRTELGGRLVRAFLVSSTLGALHGLAVFGLYLARRGGLPRAELPAGGCNTAGTVFAVAMVVALGCISFARRWEKIALIVMVAIMGAALGATQSRGALVALGAGLAVLLVTSLRSRSAKALGLAIAGLLVVFASSVHVYPPLSARYASILSPSANSDRFEIWRTAVHMMKDHPILGVGVNNFHEVYLSYPHPEERSHEVMSTAHNIFMEFGASTGIPGLVLFLSVVAIGIANGVRACVRSRTGRAPRLAPGGVTGQARGTSGVALAAFAALLAHLQFDLTIYSGNMLPLFFIVYGVLSHLGEHAPDQPEECGVCARS
ncbi:MAG: O-antigen ligase family protein [Bacillota bacterium]